MWKFLEDTTEMVSFSVASLDKHHTFPVVCTKRQSLSFPLQFHYVERFPITQIEWVYGTCRSGYFVRKYICNGLKACVPSKFIWSILIRNVMVLLGGAFGRWLGHEGSALMNGINVPIEEARREPLCLFTMWSPRWRTSQPPELWEINFYCL